MNAGQSIVIRMGDWLLGWTLLLPRDLTLVVIALVTVAVVIAIRYFTADRAALSLLRVDEQRLRELRRHAAEVRDSAELARLHNVRRLLAARRMRLELVPLILGLLPAMLILVWGARRLEYLPLSRGERFEFLTILPASFIGGHAHVVPRPNWEAECGWIRPIDSTQSGARGNAEWMLRPQAAGVTTIVVRQPDGTVEHPIEIGLPTYQPPIVNHGHDLATQVILTRYQPFGIVSGIPRLGIPAWSLGLLLLAVPLYLAAKRLFRLP